MKADIVLLRMAFEVDADYTDDGSRYYLDRKSGKVFCHYPTLEESEREIGSACNEDWRKQNLLIHTEPDRFAVVSPIGHGEWHDVFRAWYEAKYGEPWGVPTIGGTLGELSESDRADWRSCKYEYASEKAREFAQQHGLTRAAP